MKPSIFLTARSTVIALFIAISTALLVASSIPQRSTLGGKTPAWVEKLPPSLQHGTELLGLDYIVGSSWFAILITLFWISLLISTVSQYLAIKALASRIPPAAIPQESTRVDCTLSVFAPIVGAAGYREVRNSNNVHRFVKNRIGFWGNFLLHIGLVVVVFFSLVYVLTQHRVLFRLTGQEITRLSKDSVQELRGILPQQKGLPYCVVLKNLEPRFWKNDKLAELSSELYFTDKAGGDPQRVDIAVSDKSHFGPYIVYQANTYGRVFDLEFVSAQGESHRERFYLPYPPSRDKAAYGEMPLAVNGLLLKGKFFADKDRLSMKLNDSPLTLRLFQGKDFLGEITLTSGSTGQLGSLSVRLAQTEWWTDILLDGTRGTSGIFAGFALILTGVLSTYCLIPREIIARESDGGMYVQHVARRFAQFYREEFDDIVRKVNDTKRDER
ncbi:MAG: cytochrome c biogenesis protein ResB [Desulfuromonadaceae bacterium]|nr:cytochrome c biogenesis protein ResB [Desulfuromonadaceae bacterium]MDD5107290.1 cytochrome c biogenesis protein ResB [Desulfuromonadaceae bacterium]